MRESLNQSCFPELGTDRFAEIAAEAGATSVELRPLGRSEPVGAMAAAVRGAGLRVEAINGLMDWTLPDDPDPRPALERMLEIATAVGAPLIVCTAPIRMGTLPPCDRIAQCAIERLAALGAITRAANVRLALEQVGRSSTRPGASSGIRRLSKALAIVEAAGEDTLLTLDSYNIATGDEGFDEIRRIPSKRIGIAQLADCDMRGEGRALPGEGDFDLDAFVQALAAVGYEGALSLEIFPSQPWPDPLAFARKALATLRQLIPPSPPAPNAGHGGTGLQRMREERGRSSPRNQGV
jgi:hydroxypyruvate isomerase